MSEDEKKPIRLPEIIYRPDRQHRLQKWLYVVASTLAWLFWLYLFAPLVNINLRVFGWFRFDHYQLTDATHTLHVLLFYAVVVAVLGAVLIAWAIYNLLRFRGRDLRNASAHVTAADTAQHFQLSKDQIQLLRLAQVVRVHHDESGVITHIDQLQPSKQTSAA